MLMIKLASITGSHGEGKSIKIVSSLFSQTEPELCYVVIVLSIGQSLIKEIHSVIVTPEETMESST